MDGRQYENGDPNTKAGASSKDLWDSSLALCEVLFDHLVQIHNYFLSISKKNLSWDHHFFFPRIVFCYPF